jgi:hypothetical protein
LDAPSANEWYPSACRLNEPVVYPISSFTNATKKFTKRIIINTFKTLLPLFSMFRTCDMAVLGFAGTDVFLPDFYCLKKFALY